jgi:hypothetical protein
MTSPVFVSGGSGRNWVAMELAATIVMVAKKATMASPRLLVAQPVLGFGRAKSKQHGAKAGRLPSEIGSGVPGGSRYFLVRGLIMLPPRIPTWARRAFAASFVKAVAYLLLPQLTLAR